MGKITKAIYIETPPNVLYESIKKIDMEVMTMIQDFTGVMVQRANWIEDIPNQRLVEKAVGAKISLDFVPTSRGTNVTINVDFNIGQKTAAKLSIAQWAYAIKGIEAGYTSKS